MGTVVVSELADVGPGELLQQSFVELLAGARYPALAALQNTWQGWGTCRQTKTGAGFKLKSKNGPFSAVSKPNFASKYAFESSRRDVHNALLCTALQA